MQPISEKPEIPTSIIQNKLNPTKDSQPEEEFEYKSKLYWHNKSGNPKFLTSNSIPNNKCCPYLKIIGNCFQIRTHL